MGVSTQLKPRSCEALVSVGVEDGGAGKVTPTVEATAADDTTTVASGVAGA